MAGKPVIKLQIPAENNMVLDIYEEAPNQLVFEMYHQDMEHTGGGRMVVETELFMDLLERLVKKD